MDLRGRSHWVDYERAEAAIFEHTDTERSPWWLVDAEDQRRARLACISHLLAQVPYQDLTSDDLTLPPLQEGARNVDARTMHPERRWVPHHVVA